MAGFAFGNIMLFSFPEYLGLEDPYFRLWFGYLNLVLSLPVVFILGSDYFKQAWYSLKYKTFDINIPLALGILVMFLTSIYQVTTGTGPDTSTVWRASYFFCSRVNGTSSVAITIFLLKETTNPIFLYLPPVYQRERCRKSALKTAEGDELLIKNKSRLFR